MRRGYICIAAAFTAVIALAFAAAASGADSPRLTGATDISQSNPLLARALYSGGYAAGIAPEYVEQARNIRATGGLEVLILPQGPIRAGGTGDVVIDLAQTQDIAADARKVVVRVNTGAYLRVERATAPGWSCTIADGDAVCRRSRIADAAGGPNILLHVRGSASLPRGAQPITATLSATERRSGGGRILATDTSVVRAPTAPRLTVRVAREGSLRQPTTGSGDGNLVMLTAAIKGIAGSDITTRWRQLCVTKAEARSLAICAGRVAPAVSFREPNSDVRTEEHASISASLPAVTSPTPLHFSFTASDESGRASGRTTVIATPQRVLKLDPRLGELDRAIAGMTALQRDDLVGERIGNLGSSITSSTGSGTLRPGQAALLRARVPGHRVVGVRWSLTQGPKEILRGASLVNGALRIKPPAGTRGVILARARLADGTSVDATMIVQVPARPGTRARTPVDAGLLADVVRVRARGAAMAQDAAALLQQKLPEQGAARALRAGSPETTLCDYWSLVRLGRQQPLPANPALPGTPDIVLGDGTTVWLGPGATVAGDPCGATSTIDFTQGEVLVGDNHFVRVRGTITKDGLRILGGSYQPPEEWLKLVPGMKEAILKGTSFTVPSGLGITAPLTPAGGWRALGGEFRVPTGLELLDLPAGWRFQPALLRFESNGLISLTLTAQAEGGPQNGEASISGDLSPLGQLEISASVSRLGVLRQSDGTQVSLSGGGTLSFSWKDNPDAETEDSGLSLVMNPEIWVKAEGNVDLMDNLQLRGLELRWNPQEIEAGGTVRIGSAEQSNYMDLGLTGTWGGNDNWAFAVSATGSWQPGAGITVSELKGSVDRKGQITEFAVGGKAAGWKPSPALTVDSLSADVTNRCPATAKPGECNTGVVRLDLDVKGTLTLPIEGSTPTAWASTARFNLKTMKFTVTGSIADGQIGPAALNLRSIEVNISNEQDAGFCTPTTPPAKPSDGLRFGLIATGTVLGQNVSFTGQFGGDVGLCLLGSMRSMPKDTPYAGDFSAITVAYASQDVTIPRANSPPLAVRARELQISSAFELPASAKEIGLQGKGRFEASLAGSGFSGTVAVSLTPGNEPVLFGEASGSHLRMDGVLFQFDWNGPNGTRFLARAELSYLTVASAATSTAESTTPLSAEISFDTRGVTIAAGVDAARAPRGEVANAFGVADLKIRALVVTLTLGPSPSFSFDADATLPSRWSTPIGITAGSTVRLAAAISKTNPCFDFEIARPAGEQPSTTGKRMAVDLGGKGLIAASRMQLLIAPTGCTVGKRQISPGFAVAFDGQIGGTIAIPVKVEAAMTLPTPAQPTNFKLKTDINVGAFSIGGAVAFDETIIKLNIDVPANTYALQLKGGVNIFGNVNRVDAEFRSTGLGNIYLRADVQARLGLSGLRFEGDLKLELDVKSFKVQTARLNGRLDFKVLGTTLLGADAEFEYTQNRVTVFKIGVQAGIDIGIAAASGRVDVEYRLLKEPQTASNYTHRLFKVGFGGSFRIFFIRKSFYFSIVNSKVPIAEAADAVSQDSDWSDSDSATAGKAAANHVISWPIVTGRDGTKKPWTAVVESVEYHADYDVASTAGQPARGSASGGLRISVCIQIYSACSAKRQLLGTIHFQQRRIDVASGDIDLRDKTVAEACADPDTLFAVFCDGRPYALQGDDWTAALRLIEKARSEFRTANPGQELPPPKVWSADRLPETLGGFGGPHNRKDARARWTLSAGIQGDIPRTNGPSEIYFGQEYGRATSDDTLARVAPERAVPLAGDWDGDGTDDLAVWYSPLNDNSRTGSLTPRWDFRLPNGTNFTLRRGDCYSDYCGAIDPPGTLPWSTLPEDVRSGQKGAMWPLVGDWNGRTVSGITIDDTALVRLYKYNGWQMKMRWLLWPQNESEISFFTPPSYGAQPDGVVDRPVSGDWNGDGVTDVGLYRAPATTDGKGQWFLWLSTSIQKAIRQYGRELGDPDYTIAFGSYGDFPVVGDWDNSGADGIGVVAPQAGNDPRQWTLRNDADASCGANCRSDLSPHYGTNAQYPIVGRWGQ